MNIISDTIVAVATGPGGALAVIRMSGSGAIAICDSVFRAASGKPLASALGYTLHYGEIVKNSETLDDVIVSLFRTPKSYTGEEMVEISCHGSQYIQQQIVNLLISSGARAAQAGEFTLRAFLAGKLDLSQAEAVADMISATDRATHSMASNQMRGGYSADLAALRSELLTLASLLELELDFGEEDVEFADRARLLELLSRTEKRVSALAESFSLGNALKEGVAVAITGSPNVGKSTLLNALLHDDRAMVSDIAGTTRDVIEESVNIRGIRFRFLDTAGIRQTADTLEQMGIDRTYASIAKANIILLVVEAEDDLPLKIGEALQHIHPTADQKLCIVVNKTDRFDYQPVELPCDIIALSAKTGHNLDVLLDYLCSCVAADNMGGVACTSLGMTVDTAFGTTFGTGETIVSNSRHYESLLRTCQALTRAHTGLEHSLAPDLLAQDIREALHYMGTITGEITTDEILSSIFSKFCIGK